MTDITTPGTASLPPIQGSNLKRKSCVTLMMRTEPPRPSAHGSPKCLIRKPLTKETYRVLSLKAYSLTLYEDPGTPESLVVNPTFTMRNAKTTLNEPFSAVNKKKAAILIPRQMASLCRLNFWTESFRAEAEKANGYWVCLHADRSTCTYKIAVADAPSPEPERSGYPVEKLLDEAVEDHVIDSEDHEFVRRLNGGF